MITECYFPYDFYGPPGNLVDVGVVVSLYLACDSLIVRTLPPSSSKPGSTASFGTGRRRLLAVCKFCQSRSLRGL